MVCASAVLAARSEPAIATQAATAVAHAPRIAGHCANIGVDPSYFEAAGRNASV